MSSRTTTAVVFENGGTALRPLPLRALEPGEALVKIRVSGLCGTDLFKLANVKGPAQVLGHEIVGEIVEQRETQRFEPGDLVVAPHHVACGQCRNCLSGSETTCPRFAESLIEPGGFCTHAILKSTAVERAAYRLGPDLDPLRAVFLEPTACVLRGVERGGLEHTGLGLEKPQPKEVRIMIQGGGSMGLLHLLALRALRFNAHIIVVEPHADRRDLALTLGANQAVAPDQLTALVDELDRRADMVFDTVGTEAALHQALRSARPGGSVVLFAHQPSDSNVALPFNQLFRNEQRLISSYSGSLREQSLAFELLSTGLLDPRPLVTHELSLDAFDEGVRMCRAHEALKVVFRPHFEAAPSLARVATA